MVNFNAYSNYTQYNMYGAYGSTSAASSDSQAQVSFGSYFGEEDSATKGVGATKGCEECETCKSRIYVDGSDEDVSFKAPTHVSASGSTAAVVSHENEHVANAYGKAAAKDGEVVSVSVSIQMATCPECGATYAAGGTTRSQIRYTNESNPYTQNQKSLDAANVVGSNLDLSA